MDTQRILEKLSSYHKSDLETLFNILQKVELPTKGFTLGEGKALNAFKDEITECSIEVISLREYAKRVGYNEPISDLKAFDDLLLKTIQDYAEENDMTLWDYPLSEIEDVKANSECFVGVRVGKQIRLCEL